jgi:hypothetical protein
MVDGFVGRFEVWGLAESPPPPAHPKSMDMEQYTARILKNFLIFFLLKIPCSII